MKSERAHFIIAHYSEVGLKGRNRQQFRCQLQANIRIKLQSAGLGWNVRRAQSHLLVAARKDATAKQMQEAVANVAEVAGVAWCAAVQSMPHGGFRDGFTGLDYQALEAAVVELATREYRPEAAFCVRVNRASKAVALTSPELENQLGEAIRRRTAWRKVRLKKPDVTFHVDLQRALFHLFSVKLHGPAGLPAGTAGRVLVLLSGGIDSPVAAYLMARRGCNVDFIHFTATSEQQESAEEEKVWRLARSLCRYTLGSRLYLVPYANFDVALLGKKINYGLVMFRRFMLRVAERLAAGLGAEALVTGDNLSQVASQTLSNLVATSRAVVLPVFRPLLGFNKEEIIALASRIGTYGESIRPYKDCCALISRHPRTRSQHRLLDSLEKKLLPDYEELIEATLANQNCIEFACSPALPAVHR